MVIDQRLDSRGNVVFEEHDDGFIEYNEYSINNTLVRSECHYPNGLVETEQYGAWPNSNNWKYKTCVACR